MLGWRVVLELVKGEASFGMPSGIGGPVSLARVQSPRSTLTILMRCRTYDRSGKGRPNVLIDYQDSRTSSIRALCFGLERKNGWQIAEASGDVGDQVFPPAEGVRDHVIPPGGSRAIR